jgi:hypothetical protein
MGQLKRKRCRLRNHIYSRREVRKIKNHRWINNNNNNR